MYKFANYELFNRKISEFDWSCLHQGTVNEASSLFTNVFIEIAKLLFIVTPIVGLCISSVFCCTLFMSLLVLQSS